MSARSLPDALLPAHRALARRLDAHGPLLAVLTAHAPVRTHQGAGWSVLCTCAARVPAGGHGEHVAAVLAARAEEVIGELAAIAWPDDPSPLEERGFAAGTEVGRATMLDDVLTVLPAEHAPALLAALTDLETHR